MNRIIVSIFLVGLLLSQAVIPVFAEPLTEPLTEESVTESQEFSTPDVQVFSSSYVSLMRTFHELRATKNRSDEATDAFIHSLSEFIAREQGRLGTLDLDKTKKDAYLAHLQKLSTYFDAEKSTLAFRDEATELEILMPKLPAQFGKIQATTEFGSVSNIEIKGPLTPQQRSRFQKLLSFLRINSADAIGNDTPPTEADLANSGEIVVSEDIHALAQELEYSPLKIYSYVYNNVAYEPYTGSKLGSEGCLKALSCNDVDTSALLIALLRASGVPARYARSLAVGRMQEVVDMLGVGSAANAYEALHHAGVSIFLFTPELSEIKPGDVTTFDFSKTPYVGLHWTHAQAYLPYDERGGNVNEPTEHLLSNPESAWLSIDAAVKTYTHTAAPQIIDMAGISVENFWNTYLLSNNPTAPIDYLDSEVKKKTGKNLAEAVGVHKLVPHAFTVLPASLPYLVAAAEGTLVSSGEATTIPAESFSLFPDNARQKITIKLKDAKTDEIFLDHTIFTSDLPAEGVHLTYKGFSAGDEAVIASYGGIHATPANLASIAAVLSYGSIDVVSQKALSIGQNVILDFTYGSTKVTTNVHDQKFSVAGNSEGIYIAVTHIEKMRSSTRHPKLLSVVWQQSGTSMSRVCIKPTSCLARCSMCKRTPALRAQSLHKTGS